MSKSIAITLPNAIADTLERYMVAKNANLPPGMTVSKSSYIASSVRAALEREGIHIEQNQMILVPLKTTIPPLPVPEHKLPPL
jgi:translation initiation factor 2 beta subunit (eIF-2beta)/eIF-5